MYMIRNHLRLSIIRQVAKFCQPLGPHGEVVNCADHHIEHDEVSTVLEFVVPPDFLNAPVTLYRLWGPTRFNCQDKQMS